MQKLTLPHAVLFSAILAVLLQFIAPAPAQTLEDEREAFEYGQALFSDELYKTAAEEFRRFILNYPTSERLAQARLRLADAYFRAESLSKAVDAYQIFVDRHPDNIEVAAALRNRARALEQLPDHARAADAFSELYDRFRTGEYAVQDLLSAGTNSKKIDDFTSAERSLRTIITDHPSSPLLREATYNLGLVLMDQTRESEALAQFETIKDSEREPDALLEIGRIALAQDDLLRAERTFADLRKRFPRNRSAAESYLVLGVWYERQTEWSMAIETYEKARSARIGVDPRQRAILGLARVYRQTGKDALQLYTQFLKVYANSKLLPDARLGLGRSFVDKKQYRQAIDAFKRLQESFPNHPYSTMAYRDIGDVYSTLGSPRRALAAYERHLNLASDPKESAITRLNMAEVYREQLGWTDLALKVLSNLSTNETPGIAGSAQFQLGQTHEIAGDHHLALREYRKYLVKFAGQPNAKEAERRIRYLLTYAPTGPVDRELVEVIGRISDTPSTRLQLGRMLYEKRYYDEAVPHLEAARADTSDTEFVEASFLLAETLTAIDRRQTILLGSPLNLREKALTIYRQLSASGEKSDFADDAAFRAIGIEYGTSDTSAARSRIPAYEQFAKTYPTSNRLTESGLRLADAHLTLGASIPSHVDLALARYRKVARNGKARDLKEQANYGIGRCLAIKKDYVNAENVFRDFLFEYPHSNLGEEARFQLGLILLERGYIQSAASEFEELLNAPTSVELEKSSRTLLAECYFRLEDFAGAIRIDETLLARGAEPAVLKRLGEAYARTGKDEKALSILGSFVRKFSLTAGADTLAFKRAELLAQLGRTDQAINAFETWSTSYPGSALKSAALGSVARLQFERGNYEAALRAVTGQDTGDDAIAELRIVTLLRLGRTKQARKEIKIFKKKFPGTNEAIARFEVEEARVQLRYGNPKGARKRLESVIKKNPNTRASGDAEFYLIKALEKVGKEEEHLAALVSFVKNRENNAYWSQANLALARIHADEQDYVGASRAYLNALNGLLDDSERPRVLELLYDSHRNLRSYDSAISYARTLIEQYPHHALSQAARVKIGEIYSEKGAYQEAIDELLPQLKNLKDDAWSSAQNVIAESYQKMGDNESALREYLKLIYNHQGSVNWLANAFMGRAQCFSALGRNREAIDELEKIKARFAGTSFVPQADKMIKELSLNQ